MHRGKKNDSGLSRRLSGKVIQLYNFTIMLKYSSSALIIGFFIAVIIFIVVIISVDFFRHKDDDLISSRKLWALRRRNYYLQLGFAVWLIILYGMKLL